MAASVILVDWERKRYRGDAVQCPQLLRHGRAVPGATETPWVPPFISKPIFLGKAWDGERLVWLPLAELDLAERKSTVGREIIPKPSETSAACQAVVYGNR